jgi:hypothetical protein
MNELKPLLEKLTAAQFTGELHLRFEEGSIASAKLEHFLSTTEFSKQIPVVEESFSLKS